MNEVTKNNIKEIAKIVKTNINPFKMGQYLADCGVTNGKEHIAIGAACALTSMLDVGLYLTRSKIKTFLFLLGTGYGVWETIIGIEAYKTSSLNLKEDEVE